MKATLRLYQPHSLQFRFHNLAWKHKYFVCAWSRQTGKSTGALNHMARYAWENPGVTLWFVSPTHDLALIQFRRLVGMLWPCREVMLKKNQTELRVKLINGSQIVFKSGDRPDGLRSETLHGVVIDEVRDQDADLWPMIISPMLGTTDGWAIFISTPNGFDAFHELFEEAKLDRTGLWGYMQAPVTECPLWTPERIARQRSVMSEAQFAQEMMAEFRDLTKGKAYMNFTDANLSTQNPFAPPGQIFTPYLPIILAPDFNLSPMSWALGQNRGDDWHWMREIRLEDSHTQEAAKELVTVLKEHFISKGHRSKPTLHICGDATGKASQRAAAAQSDYDIIFGALREAGITYSDKTPDSNPQVKDRVNNFNAKCKDANGTRHMTVDPTGCPYLVKDCQRVTWKPGAEATLYEGKHRELTHSSDGPGYAMWALSPLKPINQVGRMRVITR